MTRKIFFIVAAVVLGAGAGRVARADGLAAPTPLTPIKDSRVVGGDVHFEWAPPEPPDGQSVRYELEVWIGVPGAEDATRVAQATQGDGQDGVTVGGLPYAGLTWQVRAVTGAGVHSAWSAATPFDTVDGVRSTVGPLDERAVGCGVGRRAVRPGLVVALLLLVAVLLIRRRS